MTRQSHDSMWIRVAILLTLGISTQGAGGATCGNPIIEGNPADPAVVLREGNLSGAVIDGTVQSAPAGGDWLAEGFARPPEQTQPWCYWYWISDNLSKEGITRDLEAMARVGIGEALIGNIFLDDVPAGRTVLSPLSSRWPKRSPPVRCR